MGNISLLLNYKNKIKTGLYPFCYETNSMKHLHPQIDVLLETIQEQFAQIKQYGSEKIPQIELDMLLSNLRKTYEFVHQINKFKQTEENVELAAVRDVQGITVPKEPSLKLKSTSLPFDVPFFNKFKKESTETPSSVPIPAPLATTNNAAKPNNGLKLESTTLPPFGPYVTIPKPEIAPVPKVEAVAPAAEITPIEKDVEAPEIKAFESVIEKIIETPEPVSFTAIIENSGSINDMHVIEEGEPVAEAALPAEVENTAPVAKEEPNEITLSFDLPIAIQDQEAMTLARKNIFKEESQSRNPLKKIVDLFEDNLPGHDKFGESFSLLDKFMKKKEDTSLVEKLRHTPVSDLRTAVGVNEKFQFINELFGGNYEDYTASIELLNKCKSFTDAEIFIAENIFDKYKWEVENRNVATFMDLVERRFL
jgi:hypothetical protein